MTFLSTGALRGLPIVGVSKNPRNPAQIAIGESGSSRIVIVKVAGEKLELVDNFTTGLTGGKKALAWDPSHPSRLAIGGGASDKTVEIWERGVGAANWRPESYHRSGSGR